MGRGLADPIDAAALLDRWLHHAVVVQIEGSSYRMRQHAGLVPESLRSTAPGNRQPLQNGAAGHHRGTYGSNLWLITNPITAAKIANLKCPLSLRIGAHWRRLNAAAGTFALMNVSAAPEAHLRNPEGTPAVARDDENLEMRGSGHVCIRLGFCDVGTMIEAGNALPLALSHNGRAAQKGLKSALYRHCHVA